MRQELPGLERGGYQSYLGGREDETGVTWVGRVRQELPRWGGCETRVT